MTYIKFAIYCLCLDVEFSNSDLATVYREPKNSTLGHGQSVDKGFRRKIQILKAANDERDLRALKSLHYEKLKGDRSHQRSIKINDQWRIVIERIEEKGRLKLVVIGVEDYH